MNIEPVDSRNSVSSNYQGDLPEGWMRDYEKELLINASSGDPEAMERLGLSQIEAQIELEETFPQFHPFFTSSPLPIKSFLFD